MFPGKPTGQATAMEGLGPWLVYLSYLGQTETVHHYDLPPSHKSCLRNIRRHDTCPDNKDGAPGESDSH